ncbi:unnamed protein product [Sympodiomycopsis kandeliae]
MARSILSGLQLLVFLAVLPLLASAALFPKNSPVVQLTASSFRKQVLDIEKPTLVAFTAPWCGHCQKLVPEYDGAARTLEGIVKFANIDCDVESNKPLCGRYGVQGFPTIKLFPATKNRIPKDYQGERAGKALIQYAIDSLPHSVKKLKAEELSQWTLSDPSKGKVLLFSNKPTSSPLYKSLALDFRKSMAFAFARGDQAPVSNSARTTLGVQIQSSADLPVLVFFPPRDGGESDFEKGKFETYSGKLKYPLLKKWLDDIKDQYNIQDKVDSSKDKAKSNKTAKESKAKAKKQPKSASSSSSQEDPLPEGAAYEWKPPSKNKGDDDEQPGILSKKRASKLAEEVRSQQKKLSKKAKGAAGDAENLAFGERHPVDSQTEQIVIENKQEAEQRTETEDSEPEHINEGPYIYTDEQKADVHVLNQILEESGAYKKADEAIAHVGKVAENIRDSAQDSFSNIRQSVDNIASKLTGKEASAPFYQKRKILMNIFEKWLNGEQPNWETDYSQEFLQATKDVEHLVATDPSRASELAWENEKWMLEQLQLDKDKMWDSIGENKKQNLQEMIDLISQRLSTRSKHDQENNEQGSMEAALRAVMNARKKKDQEMLRESQDETVIQEHPRDHHDEL